jgi:two-component system chemotaxis response regulator CheY
MGINVLVVDDSVLIRNVLKKMLGQTGLKYETFLQAGNGREALDIIEKNPVGLVMIDINMPVMNGMEMLMALRQLEDHRRDIPVIVITTEGSEETMAQAMELGANGYVLKPFTPEQLADTLRKTGLIEPQDEQASPNVDFDDPAAF